MEILSTGTPIIVLPNQTSILQLTLGFYKVMQENDLDDEKLLTKYCIAETMDEYIDKAIHIASSTIQKREDIMKYIKTRIYKLYKSSNVILEWDKFFEYVM